MADGGTSRKQQAAAPKMLTRLLPIMKPLLETVALAVLNDGRIPPLYYPYPPSIPPL